MIWIGILVAVWVWLVLAPPLGGMPRGRAASALANAYSLDGARRLSELKTDSLEYRLLAAGIHWQPATVRIVSILAGVGGALAVFPFLPGIPALAVGGLVCCLPTAWLKEKVQGRGREIDKRLPVAIGRITAGLLAGGSVADVLDETAASLELEGQNPLSPELQLTAAELRSKERSEALQGLANRSPSISLANLAYLLEGYLAAGGGKYAQVLAETAARVQQILAARNRTQAKAGDAMLSAKVIPAVLALVVAYLAQDPMIQATLRVVPVQIVIALTIGAMALGYFLMRSLVREAV